MAAWEFEGGQEKIKENSKSLGKCVVHAAVCFLG